MNRRIFLILGLFTLLALVPVLSQELYESDIILPERGLCAHRGAMATHPENTIPAFREAVIAGAHMLEFDVFLTRDNHMVVIHDDSVDRTTNGTGKVSDLTLEQIKSLDAGSWKSPEFAGTEIPTLDEVLAVMPVNVWLNIHLKGEGSLPVMVAEKIASENRLHQAFLACGRKAADLARRSVPGIMICNMDRQNDNMDYINETIESEAEFIQLTQPITPLLSDYTRRLKEKGIRVNFFGTDSPEEIRLLFKSGVDFPLVNDIIHLMKIAGETGIPPAIPQFKSQRQEG
ncbi:MAG: glycerophosphodiester phosphodiesterase [Bacteroidales bacterium]|jgi:glycerophosphoryl diester phosphodiesterase|nr:glycerophosphodiester phosphodiesterase [Bacteroidales bacterium]